MLHKSWSTDSKFHSIFSWWLMFLVTFWFDCLNLPFFIRHEATALGFIKFGFGEMFFLPVSLLIVAQALRLECFGLSLSMLYYIYCCHVPTVHLSPLIRNRLFLLKIVFYQLTFRIPTRNIGFAKIPWVSPFCNIEHFFLEHRVAVVSFCVRWRKIITHSSRFCFKTSPICFVEIPAWYQKVSTNFVDWMWW